MSSPDLSDDPFDSYGQWDQDAGSSQRLTETNQLQLYQLLDWDTGKKKFTSRATSVTQLNGGDSE
jgi:hypothetical protein